MFVWCSQWPEPRAGHAQVSASDLRAEAEHAENAADPGAAADAWRRVIEAAPTSRDAARARRRVEWLEARSEGGYLPLSALMRYQSRPTDTRDLEGARAFAVAVDRMPAGIVRREARLVLANDLSRLGAHQEAFASYRALLDEPGMSDDERRRMIEILARALARTGQADEARALLAAESLVESEIGRRLRNERRRAILGPISWSIVIAFLAVAAWVGYRSKWNARSRRGWVIWAVGLLWVIGLPVAIATSYDHEAGDTFSMLAAGLFGVLAITGLVANAGMTRRQRVALALASALAVLAVGYLVGDRSDSLLSFAE